MYGDFEPYFSVTSSETWSRFISRTENDFTVRLFWSLLFFWSLIYFLCQSSFNELSFLLTKFLFDRLLWMETTFFKNHYVGHWIKFRNPSYIISQMICQNVFGIPQVWQVLQLEWEIFFLSLRNIHIHPNITEIDKKVSLPAVWIGNFYFVWILWQ